jgi:TPP-dependent trihydroxycyclohexane-1,2-dione (THcHDO) dehydratase
MTKKDKQREAILQHGFKLIRVFNLPAATSPVELCKKIHRIEAEAHRFAERYCNGEVTEEEDAKKETSVLKRLDAILNFKVQGIPVFVNGDPRGYALKIKDDYVREHNLDIYRDWGGYGILAPEF